MVPAPTDFGFTARVCAAGYRWLTGADLAARLPTMGGVNGGHFLAEVIPPGGEREEVVRRPTRDPVLFREFADLDANDPAALTAFANAHGPLGVPDSVYSGAGGPAWALPPQVDDSFRHHPYIKAEAKTAQLWTESSLAWRQNVSEMRTAAGVLDGLRGRDAKRLRALFRWRPLAADRRDSPGAWYIDTHPGRPAGERAPDRVEELVFGEHVGGRFDPIETVALTYLVHAVNRQLHTVNPALSLEADGRVVERLGPQTLLSAMWAQVYGALTGGKSYDRCRACAKWFEVTGRAGGHTVRRMYCSDACRVRVYRDRRDRAEQLAGEGLAAAAIVERLKGEGHETDLATVKKWVRNATKRGK